MSVVLDICGIVIALSALSVSLYTAYLQRTHDRRSVMPIGAVIEKYHDHNIAVLIVNRGLGVMTIDAFHAEKNGRNAISSKNLITYMPQVGQTWKGFSVEIEGRTVLPNQSVVLCAIDPKDEAVRKQILEALNGITVTVEFHDIYGKKYKISKELGYKRLFWENLGYRAE